MARLTDKTWLTEDEGYNLPWTIGQKVEKLLGSLDLDSYNEQYVIRVTVDKIDEPEGNDDDED